MSGDIELEIGAAVRPGCYEVRVVRSAGGGEPSGRLVVDIAEILARRRELEMAVLASGASARQKVTSVEQPVREVGQRLFEALFNGPVYGAYRASLGAVQQGGERLRVVLRLTAPELAALPWEALFDPETQSYLCRREPLVRHVPAPFTQPPLEIRPPLRILGLVASPRGLPVLDVETEQQNLQTALAEPIADGLVELAWMNHASWEAIHTKLLGGEWHVLHFIGHGDYDAGADEGVLYLVGADGRAKGVEASRLTDLLGEARPPLRLVVLNSCSSGESGSQDLFSGTAALLAHNGIDGVAAMQYSITDTAAIAFTRGFYTALAHGLTIDEAARSGRVEILGLGHTLEWVTPVLYVRGDATRPFIITGKPPVAEPSRPATEAADPTAEPHRLPGLDSPRPARRPRLRRRAFPVSRKRLAVIAGIIICAAGALAAAVSLIPSTPAHHQITAPTPAPPRIVALAGLRVGDCIQGTPGTNLYKDISAKTVSFPNAVEVVPCGDAHVAEVFFADNYWTVKAAFPGENVIAKQSGAECNDVFQTYVGVPLRDSLLDWSDLYPWKDWSSGDRRLLCVAYYSSPLKGTVRGSGSSLPG